MDSTWGLANALWGLVIVAVVIAHICDARKSPEQKAAEAEAAKERRKENRAREKARRQEIKENMPEKGCLQSTIEFGFVCLFCMIAVLFAIMVLTI